MITSWLKSKQCNNSNWQLWEIYYPRVCPCPLEVWLYLKPRTNRCSDVDGADSTLWIKYCIRKLFFRWKMAMQFEKYWFIDSFLQDTKDEIRSQMRRSHIIPLLNRYWTGQTNIFVIYCDAFIFPLDFKTVLIWTSHSTSHPPQYNQLSSVIIFNPVKRQNF